MRYPSLVMLLLATLTVQTAAQDRPAAPPSPAPPAAPTPQPPAVGPLRNLRFDIIVSDTGIPKPTTKTVSLLVLTGREGQIRSSANEPQSNPAFTKGVPLNVDVIRPSILDDGNILVSVNIEYQPSSPGTSTSPALVRAKIEAILRNGRKTLISQTPDPISDRVTTIEVTATVLQ